MAFRPRLRMHALGLALAGLLGGCSPATLLRSAPAQEASWAVDPTAELTPESTQIPLLVVETDCASGQDARGRISVEVDDAADRVTITAYVTPLGGDQACPGNPPTPFLLDLPTPLGDRQLVNGATGDLARRPVEVVGDGPLPDAGGGQGTVVDDGSLTEHQRFVVEALHARGRDASELADLADLSLVPDAVDLLLGDTIRRSTPPSELADPAAWVIRAELFAGRSGEFSALEALGQVDRVRAALGPQRHCASPPRPSPADLAELTRIAITPANDGPCLDWFVVNLYLDDGLVRAIQLDLWEP